jgi:HEAT repeat protein
MEAGELRGLLWDLGINRDGTTALLKERLAANPLGFVEAAAELLAGNEDGPGRDLLRNILRDGTLVANIITDPEAGELEAAVRAVEKILRVEPFFDLQLARWLVRRPRPPEDCDARQRRLRALEVLRRVGNPARLTAFQVQLLRENDPNVRSKAAQLMAEITRDAAWFRERLADFDPRVRSNTIETLWESDWEEAVALFELALQDTHHRVVTTALVGLALAGQKDRVVEKLLEIAGDGRAEFRAAAAWAMEQIPDQRFRPALMTLTRDATPTVRPRAFAALRAIERRKRARHTESPNEAPDPPHPAKEIPAGAHQPGT